MHNEHMILKDKESHQSIYKQTLIAEFGKELNWNDVMKLPKHKIRKFRMALGDNIQLEESPYDIKALAQAIQNSRSGIGGDAMTNFKCALCGTEEMWGNTAVPNICNNCATEMAEKIILNDVDLLKQENEK